MHINTLELLAGYFAISRFAKDKVNYCIWLRMGNVSAVWYVNHMGGTRSSALAWLSKNFLGSCLDRNIMVQAEYLPSLHNKVANWYSRHLSDSSDWHLHQSVFLEIPIL